MKFIYPIGATPLNGDEIYDLIPGHIATQDELNEWEQYNILLAEEWAFKRKRKIISSIDFAQTLHRKMFDKTWKWAGKFRRRQTNIGVEGALIPQELKILFDDIAYQTERGTYGIREIAARFHHRLVWIHPFPNGNGRFSRLFADLFLVNAGEPKFSWGRENLVNAGETRNSYLRVLRDADRGDYSGLLEFVDS